MKDAVKDSARLHEIDGIRGWAAFAVLLFHLTYEIFGVIFPVYRLPYWKFFINGTLAVFIFFVLSGDALSTGYVRSKELLPLARISLKRYCRLTGPIFISALIVFILMCFNLVYSRDAAPIVHREDWLGAFLRFGPDFVSLLRYGLMGVYTSFTPAPPYNAFLWPMSIELAGSFMTFSFLIAYKDLKNPALVAVLAALFLWLFASYYSLFFVGILFSILRSRNFFTNFRQRKNSTAITLCGAILVVVVEWIMEANQSRSDHLLILQAALFVFCVYGSRWGVSFFSNAVSRYLGRISFALYLVQFATIVSLTSWMIKYYDDNHALALSTSLIVIGASIVATVILADIVSRLERVYLRYLDAWTRTLFIK